MIEEAQSDANKILEEAQNKADAILKELQDKLSRIKLFKLKNN
ncbi:MAG: hypothetical protein ACLR43_04915 [Faecalibacillus faecis]